LTNLKISDMCKSDRPRERLCRLGAGALTNAELLAILIGSGTQGVSALQIATQLTAHERLYREVARWRHVQDFQHVKGLGTARAARILAALELGKRLACASAVESACISSPDAGAQYLMGRLRRETHERFLVLLLNTKNRVIQTEQIAEGSLNSAVVHPRRCSPRHYGPCGGHPGGAQPSVGRSDSQPGGPNLTQVLAKTGEIMGIPVLDHLVIGDGVYYSFKEHGEL
jgi:DNA repair protein RadC